MQRYFVDRDQMKADKVTITEDVKHITRVMRMGEGDELICCDNDSRTVRAVITKQTEEAVEADIVEELNPQTELPVKVTIAQGLPKGDKLELIIQKGTELGAAGFLPFSATRSVVKWDSKKSHKKVERLGKIVKEAAEQSYRERIPVVEDVHSFKQLMQRVPEFDQVIVAYEEAAKSGEKSNLVQVFEELERGKRVLVVIGPEGGLSEQEIEQLTEANARICGFGPRILRTETAALYALVAISYHFELMR